MTSNLRASIKFCRFKEINVNAGLIPWRHLGDLCWDVASSGADVQMLRLTVTVAYKFIESWTYVCSVDIQL